MQQESKNDINATRDVETKISARRAAWDAEMEESASHHVIQCFLLRLRRQKRNFIALRASEIQFLMDLYMFQKFEKWWNFVKCWISVQMCSGGLVAATPNGKQIQKLEIKTKFTLIYRQILHQLNATEMQKCR